MVLFAAIHSTEAQAQGGGDPAARMQQMKERIKPQLVEKTKLTEEQADKVIEIRFDFQRQAREARNDQSLNDEQRTKKMTDLQAARDKKLAEIPLTADQVKAVNGFFDEMRQQGGNRGGGNGN